MKWAEALAALDRLPTTYTDKARNQMSPQSGGRIAVPDNNQFVLPPSPINPGGRQVVIAAQHLPPFWDLDIKGRNAASMIGNGLLIQLGYDTSSKRIRKIMVVRNPGLLNDRAKALPSDTEIEKLMEVMNMQEKRNFRLAMVEALNHIIRDQRGDIERAARFCARFSNVFTLNLDVLQPTVYDHINNDPDVFRTRFQDAFEKKGQVGLWSEEAEQNWYYPHGNVILAHEPKGLKDYKIGMDVLNNRHALNRVMRELNARPLVILDSDAKAKLATIQQSPYLRNCLVKLSEIKGSICIYGLGLEKHTDEHLWGVIDENDGIEDIYIAVKSITRQTLADVKRLLPKQHLKVTFFDRDSI